MLSLSELLSNQRLRLGDLLAAQAADAPQAPALREEGGLVTRGALQERIGACADRLARAGLRTGDRVMMVLESGAPALPLIFGALALEAVVVPVTAGRPDAELATLRRFCEPRLVIQLPRSGEPQIEQGPGGAPEETGQSAMRQPAFIVFPPGPRQRGVVLGHRGLAWNAALLAQERQHGEGDTLCLAESLAHPSAFVEALAMLHAGGCCEILPPDPALLEGAVARGVADLVAPAATLAALCDRATPELARNRLRAVPLAAAAEGLAEKLEAALGLPPLPFYAAPEAGPFVACHRPGQAARGGSALPPLPAVELRVVDADGQPVPVDTAGELLVRSTGVMLCIWRDPVATTAAFASGRFLRSGALASRDEDGHLTIHGTQREVVMRGGFGVQTGEIEAVLEAHPGVAHVLVCGHHNGHEEELLALVQPREGAPPPEPERLATLLAAKLAPYKRPSRILVVSRLPLGPGGEIRRDALHDLLA